MKRKRKCFAVLLVIVFVIVDPYVTKAGDLYKQPCREFGGVYIQENGIYCFLNGGNLPEDVFAEFEPKDLPLVPKWKGNRLDIPWSLLLSNAFYRVMIA